MAGEAYAFDSPVTGPIIKKHCNFFTSEIAMKMEKIQPLPGVWDFTGVNDLVSRCKPYGIKTIGHCLFWHMQNPDWLWSTLHKLDMPGRYALLKEHVIATVSTFATELYGLDVFNEYGAIFERDSWGYYLGRECVAYAYMAAREALGASPCKLYYNSFFPTENDIDLAISLLPFIDGIGVQLHLTTGVDYTGLHERIDRLARNCKATGRVIRFSEISVQDFSHDLVKVADMYAMITTWALEYKDILESFTTWGVKYPLWDGRHGLFDRSGLATPAFHKVASLLS